MYRGAVINVFGNHITIVDVDKAAEDWHVTFHSDTSRRPVDKRSAVLHVPVLSATRSCFVILQVFTEWS